MDAGVRRRSAVARLLAASAEVAEQLVEGRLDPGRLVVRGQDERQGRHGDIVGASGARAWRAGRTAGVAHSYRAEVPTPGARLHRPMRTPLLLYALAVLVRLPAWSRSRTPPTPTRPTTSMSPGRWLPVRACPSTSSGSSPRSAATLPADPTLPIPSNAHWLPLASFIQAPFIVLFGPNAFASALPLVLIGATAAPLTWAIARDAGATPLVQVAAGVLAAIPAAGTVFMAQPENFAIFQPLVAATLWLAARGLRGDVRSYVLAGLLVGIASLARNDAFLLGAAVGLVFVIDRWRAWRQQRPAHLPLVAAVGCFALYLLVVGPWFARQLLEFGSISPTSSTGRPCG